MIIKIATGFHPILQSMERLVSDFRIFLFQVSKRPPSFLPGASTKRRPIHSHRQSAGWKRPGAEVPLIILKILQHYFPTLYAVALAIIRLVLQKEPLDETWDKRERLKIRKMFCII